MIVLVNRIVNNSTTFGFNVFFNRQKIEEDHEGTQKFKKREQASSHNREMYNILAAGRCIVSLYVQRVKFIFEFPGNNERERESIMIRTAKITSDRCGGNRGVLKERPNREVVLRRHWRCPAKRVKRQRWPGNEDCTSSSPNPSNTAGSR